jgi:protein TonB
MEIKAKQISIHKEIFLSIALHTLCIAGVIFSTLTNQYPETIRVFLTLDPTGGGAGGREIRQTTETANNSQSPPAERTSKRRNSYQPPRFSHPKATTDEAQVKPTEDIMPAMESAPAEETVLSSTISYGPLDDAVVSDIAQGGDAMAGGKGTGFGGGTGSGIGSGSGIGTGSGSGIGSGNGPGHERAESVEALKNRYLREHFAYIRDIILKNIVYPPMAKKLGWQGKVKVSFVIKEDGKVERIKIMESSGYSVLDRNVVQTIRDVQPFPKPPVRAELVIPVAYVLKS